MKVGLTGGIGSGKSTVAGVFARQGAMVIDADAIQRTVVARGSVGLARVADRFGDAVLTPGGDLDRAALARVVFADREALRDLEEITHPLIAAETRRRMDQVPCDEVVVHDIPLLVELHREQDYDLVVVVDAPAETRIARLISDRGMTREEAQARIAAQATDEQRRAVAQVWIENDGDRAALVRRAEEVWREEILTRMP